MITWINYRQESRVQYNTLCQDVESWEEFEINNVFPQNGFFSVKDTFGIGLVVYIFKISLKVEKYADRLQFDTIRKLRTWYVNIWHISSNYLSVSVLAKQKNKLYVTDCHSHSLWFEKFFTGMQTRILGEVRQDIKRCRQNLSKN